MDLEYAFCVPRLVAPKSNDVKRVLDGHSIIAMDKNGVEWKRRTTGCSYIKTLMLYTLGDQVFC